MSNTSPPAPIILRAFNDVLIGKLAGNSSFVANQQVINFLIAWAQLEGGGITNGAAYNPLNTMQQEPGSVNFNTKKPGSGVQSYPDDNTGIQGTYDALKGGAYPNIVHAIVTDDIISLGFNSPNTPMQANIAQELAYWRSGKTSLTYAPPGSTEENYSYVLSIMNLAGISNPMLEDRNGTAYQNFNNGQSQSSIDAYANKSLGPDTSGLTVGGAQQNQNASLWTWQDVLKVGMGAFMLLIGAVLLIKSLTNTPTVKSLVKQGAKAAFL